MADNHFYVSRKKMSNCSTVSKMDLFEVEQEIAILYKELYFFKNIEKKPII